MNDKLIPVKNVPAEAPTRDQVLDTAIERATAVLKARPDFVLIDLAGNNPSAIAACTDEGVTLAALSLVCMVGAGKLGDAAVAALPPAVAQAAAMAAGLAELNKWARSAANAAGAQLKR